VIDEPRRTPLFAECAALNARRDGAHSEDYAEALLRACAPLDDEALRKLPATPDEAAEALLAEPFAGRAPGVLLACEWLESFATALDLPLADVPDGWTISDGQTIFVCPLVSLADDPDSPDDRRPFARLDQVAEAAAAE
jgi:hypothetical protein